MTAPARVFACTTTTCPERFRGFTDEPTFCSVCSEDLAELANAEGLSLEELNARAELVRPRAEVIDS